MSRSVRLMVGPYLHDPRRTGEGPEADRAQRLCVAVMAGAISPRTGGAHRLIEQALAHATSSRHRFVCFRSREGAPASLAANVESVTISPHRRRLLQLLLNGPYLLEPVAASATIGERVVGRLMGATDELVAPDLALWPHAFFPVPAGRAPVAAIVHDLIHHRLPELFSRRQLQLRRSAERSLERCALLLCPSQSTAADLAEAHPSLAKRIAVFPEGPGIVPQGPPSGPALAEVRERVGAGRFFLSVGFDWPHKNFEVLLEAVRRLDPGSVKLVLAGGRRRGLLDAAIAHHRVESSVVDLGPVSDSVLDVLYRSATALLFPSLYEGFGIPLVEAMHYGLAIVASDRASVPEIVGDCGWIVSARAPGEWADAIEAVGGDDALRGELASRAAARAREYTWDRCWKALDRGFEEAVGQASSR